MIQTDNAIAVVIDFQEKMMPVIQNQDKIIKKSAIFIEGCRLLGVPIITTQQYTKGLGETVPEIKQALFDFKPIEKLSFSCWGSEAFVNHFENHDRDAVFILGVEAHICVQQTVLDLLEEDCDVYVLADCIGTRFETDFQYAIRRMEQAGAIITTAESALFEMMMRADHPHRKEITKLVK
ncbi:MAG: hydrolase [Oscillospiraceae bacterium]|nr:hydrolase [Oscillospiraceae bacterium]